MKRTLILILGFSTLSAFADCPSEYITSVNHTHIKLVNMHDCHENNGSYEVQGELAESTVLESPQLKIKIAAGKFIQIYNNEILKIGRLNGRTGKNEKTGIDGFVFNHGQWTEIHDGHMGFHFDSGTIEDVFVTGSLPVEVAGQTLYCQPNRRIYFSERDELNPNVNVRIPFGCDLVAGTSLKFANTTFPIQSYHYYTPNLVDIIQNLTITLTGPTSAHFEGVKDQSFTFTGKIEINSNGEVMSGSLTKPWSHTQEGFTYIFYFLRHGNMNEPIGEATRSLKDIIGTELEIMAPSGDLKSGQKVCKEAGYQGIKNDYTTKQIQIGSEEKTFYYLETGKPIPMKNTSVNLIDIGNCYANVTIH